ncbi:hypothetical protein V1514DRAFT_312290 [Lipomyces japonicus]|uniref:uncharacterized protein n=1 Tax=Lipomyces japonicus TaxID=56871 RepID=UPI0034CE2DC3
MKFRRHKTSARHKPKGSRRQRQSSPPAIPKKSIASSAPDGEAKIVKKIKKKRVSKREDEGGNTPRQFLELMNRMNKPQTTKSKDAEPTATTTTTAAEAKKAALAEIKRESGESLADFTRRVNEALPIIRAKTGVPSAAAVRQAKRREKAEANGQKPLPKKKKKSDPVEENEDDGINYSDEEEEERAYLDFKSQRSRSPDPWKKIAKRNVPKFGEVADAPPVLNAPAKKLQNVPKSAGTAAQRMLLEAERETVIARYRAMNDRKMAKLASRS